MSITATIMHLLSIPVPDFAKIKSWPCLETNGEIFVWFHAEGAEPSWTPPVIEEIANGKMKYHGMTEHVVNAHVEVSHQKILGFLF